MVGLLTKGRSAMVMGILSIIILLAAGAAGNAGEMAKPVNAGDLAWGPAPNTFPPGAQAAVVSGDFTKNEPCVFV